jgi:hypothetical protein
MVASEHLHPCQVAEVIGQDHGEGPWTSVPRMTARAFKLNADRQVDYLEHCNSVFRARAAALIYTAFTNLICNREITYGRDK